MAEALPLTTEMMVVLGLLAFAVILFVTVFGAANIYVKALNRVKQR